jgi:hypothetical protein
MILSTSSTKYTVPGKNITVTGSLSLVRKSLDGDDSATDTVAAGNKPKQLSVALTLPYSSVEQMQALTQTAEAIDANGDPLEYAIADLTAKALNIRQVIFAGDLRCAQQDTLQAWSVSFSLQEVRSIAEKIEGRLATNAVTAVTADGETVTATGDSSMAKLLQVAKTTL